MDFIKIQSWQSYGLENKPVRIEALRSRGLSQLQITGLPDAWLRESRDKIKTLVSRLVEWGPLDRILIHLLPADENKSGAHLELPIALACLAVLSPTELSSAAAEFLRHYSFVGALSLEGSLEPTPLSPVFESCESLAAVGPVRFASLAELWLFITELSPASTLPEPHKIIARPHAEGSRVEPEHSPRGRYWERYLLLSAAIARLPVLLLGPPGSGKSFLARWARQLLSAPDAERSAEIAQIWSLAGLIAPRELPMVTPHSRTHLSEFIGSTWKGIPRPGFFSLAHGGLLILDEFAEMNRDCREILRTILDEKKVLRSAGARVVQWPADFWLIATANPCPCGGARGEGRAACRCPVQAAQLYQNRFSGPLLDRMGLKFYLGFAEDPRSMDWVGGCEDLLDGKKECLADYVARHQVIARGLRTEALVCIENCRALSGLSERERKNKSSLLAAMWAQSPAHRDAHLAAIQELSLLESGLFHRERSRFQVAR